MKTANWKSALLTIVSSFAIAFSPAIYEWRVRALTSRLVGLQLPDFQPEYIPKHLRKSNQREEIQKQIDATVQKAIEDYRREHHGSE